MENSGSRPGVPNERDRDWEAGLQPRPLNRLNGYTDHMAKHAALCAAGWLPMRLTSCGHQTPLLGDILWSLTAVSTPHTLVTSGSLECHRNGSYRVASGILSPHK